MQSASQKNKDVIYECEQQKREKDNPPQRGDLGEQQLEKICRPVQHVSHSLPRVGLDTHGGTCIYMHVWCPAQGHSITACPLPRCACSPLSRVRHHSVGVSSNLIQEALWGAFFGGGVGGGITWHIQT